MTIITVLLSVTQFAHSKEKVNQSAKIPKSKLAIRAVAEDGKTKKSKGISDALIQSQLKVYHR